MYSTKHLKFPFSQTCLIQIRKKKIEKSVTCELAQSVIEIFQSLKFREKKDFIIPLVLKFENPNIQSFVLSDYAFSVEHICIDENNIVDKLYTQPFSKIEATFIQGYSSFKFIILAPVGFIKDYKIEEKTTAISLINLSK
ncbi:MAG: hypothetical protein M3004_11255 [Bacteroidota bacterium]|nr:hypothetical protein [Bacteroidota bacterium]